MLFRNEYTMDRKLFKEYVLNILCKDIIIVGILLEIALIVMAIINSSLYDFAGILFVLFFVLICPCIMIKNLEDNSKRLNNGKIEKTIVNFNDNIVMDEGKVHLEFEYSQIKKIKQTKNFFVLMISSKSAILVYKEGFVEGNKDEFLNFIKNKQ